MESSDHTFYSFLEFQLWPVPSYFQRIYDLSSPHAYFHPNQKLMPKQHPTPHQIYYFFASFLSVPYFPLTDFKKSEGDPILIFSILAFLKSLIFIVTNQSHDAAMAA